MIYSPHPLKRCGHCGQYYSLDGFGFDKNVPDGRNRVCKTCVIETRNRSREKRKDKAAERAREYRREHREQDNERRRIWRRDNPEKIKEIQKRYYANHKQEELSRSAEWRQKNQDYDRRRKQEWRRKNWHKAAEANRMYLLSNRVKALAYGAKRRQATRQLPHELSPEEWRNCLTYFDHRCAVCGRPVGLWHAIAADHWIPIASPNCPGTIATNIIPLCHGVGGCNNSKRNSDPIEWITQKYGAAKAKEILKRIDAYFASLNK